MLNEQEVKLKICMLAPTPFPANQGTPGAIKEMAESLSDRGHEVHIVTYHCGQDIPVKGPQIHRIPALVRETSMFVGPTATRPLYDLQMIFKTLEVLRTHQPDLMHAHGYEAALIARSCQVLTGLPILYSGHNTMADELPSYNFIRPRWLARLVARGLDVLVPRLADRCLPHSSNMDGFFRGMGLAARTSPVIPFGINLKNMAWTQEEADQVRSRYQLGSNPMVLYTGLVDEFQRLDLLLEAMAEVSMYEPEARLFIVTTIAADKHLARLHSQAEALKISDRMIITEPQRLESIPAFLGACDVAVVPRPQVPGYPIKLLNYMATRKPAVLFASSANGLKHGHNAYLAAPDTAAALGEGILEVLRDNQLSKRIARNGQQFVREHHDRAVIASHLYEAYYQTLRDTDRLGPLAHRPHIKTRGARRHAEPDTLSADFSSSRAQAVEKIFAAGS
jgi:1,2-diacylglycerol 3-alpha-glucosyltransferase